MLLETYAKRFDRVNEPIKDDQRNELRMDLHRLVVYVRELSRRYAIGNGYPSCPRCLCVYIVAG